MKTMSMTAPIAFVVAIFLSGTPHLARTLNLQDRAHHGNGRRLWQFAHPVGIHEIRDSFPLGRGLHYFSRQVVQRWGDWAASDSCQHGIHRIRTLSVGAGQQWIATYGFSATNPTIGILGSALGTSICGAELLCGTRATRQAIASPGSAHTVSVVL